MGWWNSPPPSAQPEGAQVQKQGEIPMSVTAREAETGTGTLARLLRVWLQAVRTAAELHAEQRAQDSLSPAKLQEADREIRRYRRLMHPGK